MKYTDGGGILLVTDGPLSREEWERLMKYVADVLNPERPRTAIEMHDQTCRCSCSYCEEARRVHLT
jgi:hypothetical protein